MDLIAPGSDSIVYTTGTNNSGDTFYQSFTGTSSAAPHVSGVVGLLLSHYNRDCYSNRNLSMEDVEYILGKSATDLYGAGYDDTTGWGRLDAGAALKMIEHPIKQIVHPNVLLSSDSVAVDTIVLAYREALTALNWGPISTPWLPERNHNYKVARITMENTYDLSMFIDTTTEILDYWVRPSVSNSCRFFEDTVSVYDPYQMSFVDTTFDFDIFDLTPYDTIVQFDSVQIQVKTRGYFYHFIDMYTAVTPNYDDSTQSAPDSLIFQLFADVDYWYPIDPFTETADLLFSLYLMDTTLTQLYDFPCDSVNLLYDEHYLDSLNDYNTSLDLGEVDYGNIFVYPNPFKDNISVEFGELKGEKHLIVRDVNGKIIGEYKTHNSSYTLNTKMLNNGLYFLSCIALDESKTFKIIKQ
jgi:hypothetical protein